MPWNFVLTDDFEISERGCLCWIMGDDASCHWVWWSLKDGRYLRVNVVPDNYPGVFVAVVQHASDQELEQHILNNFGGWNCRHSKLVRVPGRQSVPEVEEVDE
jgi:hypothetical protein